MWTFWTNTRVYTKARKVNRANCVRALSLSSPCVLFPGRRVNRRQRWNLSLSSRLRSSYASVRGKLDAMSFAPMMIDGHSYSFSLSFSLAPLCLSSRLYCFGPFLFRVNHKKHLSICQRKILVSFFSLIHMFADFTSISSRLQLKIIEKERENGDVVIDDAHSSSPSSRSLAGIHVCLCHRKDRKIALFPFAFIFVPDYRWQAIFHDRWPFVIICCLCSFSLNG